jgi:hypothetical protein
LFDNDSKKQSLQTFEKALGQDHHNNFVGFAADHKGARVEKSQELFTVLGKQGNSIERGLHA